MSVQPALLLIADIGGYTRFLKHHRTSLAHAQVIVARLLETVIDHAELPLRVAKLEGDAVFFHSPLAAGTNLIGRGLPRVVARMHQAFRALTRNLAADNTCPCDACTQVGDLNIKFVAHAGEVAIQKVKQHVELAGLDVIVVHRLLKNHVPVPEYLLITAPVFEHLDGDLRQSSVALSEDLEGVGPTAVWYLDLQTVALPLPPPPPAPSWPRRQWDHLVLIVKALPYMVGLRRVRPTIAGCPTSAGACPTTGGGMHS